MKHRPMSWTPKEEAILLQSAVEGRPMVEIARKLGRSENAVRRHANVLRILLGRSKLKRRLK
jgi:DNA-directed RNA polymerase specialized sigma24 family protein